MMLKEGRKKKKCHLRFIDALDPEKENNFI
jgi:hypothetical protein